MRRLTRLFLVCYVAWAAPQVVAQDPPASERGQITSVTLYRGQALVTRQLSVDGPAGSRELVVTDLPAAIIDGSLYAEAGEGIEVRAVRLRQQAVSDEPREEVRQLDDQIAQLNDQLQLNQKLQELAARKIEHLNQLDGFVAPTAHAELAQGVLNAETLQQLTDFSFKEREAIANQQVELARQQQQLQSDLELAQRQRNLLAAESQRTINEAVLFVEKHAEGPQQLTLNYLASNCGWSPTYTIRTGVDQAQIAVEYDAVIQQMTGEDWSNVALTLSTASPALSAQGPSLAPFYVALMSQPDANGAAQTGEPGFDLSVQYKGLSQQQMAAQARVQTTVDFAQQVDANWALNEVANAFACAELVNPSEVTNPLRSQLTNEEGPSLSYQLAGPVSLASRSDQQMVRIMRAQLPSEFYHVATPALSSYVYREAELKNNSDQDLLAGQVTVYLDGRFVGRSEIPTVARGETFVVGFGADPQLRVARELADRGDEIQGGNRELKLTYRVTINNYKNEPQTVRVYERLPYSDQSHQVRVALNTNGVELSDDPTYRRHEYPKGILRWDVEVAGNAIASEAWELEYSYTVDYDRNFELTAAATGADRQEEFWQLEKARQKR